MYNTYTLIMSNLQRLYILSSPKLSLRHETGGHFMHFIDLKYDTVGKRKQNWIGKIREHERESWNWTCVLFPMLFYEKFNKVTSLQTQSA